MRQIDIFRFWLPLFASWCLMALDGPLVSAAVNRLPNEVEMLAAFGIVFTLEILIESPVINLLATATALVDDRASYEKVRAFTLHLAAILTVVAALVALTPLYDLIIFDILAVPSEVAKWVRPGLVLMIPWTAFIAWRRFLQGVMIRYGHTRKVGWGTAVRSVTVVTTAGSLLAWGGLPGIHVAAITLVFGVVAEMIYAHVTVRSVLRHDIPATSDGGSSLTYREILAFHIPLAGTALLTLLIQPMVSFALARLDRPIQSLAAWPLVTHWMFFMRTPALALPEVVIALSKRPGGGGSLGRFSNILAAASFTAILIFITTPLVDLYLLGLQNTTAAIAELAHEGFLYLIPLPVLAVWVALLRGRLMERRRTRSVNIAMVVRLLTFAAVLGLGLWREWPGIVTAAVATDLSLVAELGILGWRRRRAPTAPPPRQSPG